MRPGVDEREELTEYMFLNAPRSNAPRPIKKKLIAVVEIGYEVLLGAML
jgi:hypothetical protein